ncbi:MAG: FG-GAP-like repeat-containing protein [Acidobacteriota bacterium]
MRICSLHVVLPVLIVGWCCASIGDAARAEIPTRALELRDRGLGELENEHPEKAEPIYRELAELVPDDPLPHANLAIALLRRQQHAEALEALARAVAIEGESPRLLALRGEILQWTGDLEAALKALEQAVEESPQGTSPADLETLYAAYSLATTLDSPHGKTVATDVLRRLVTLRPENVVVLLQLGQHALEADDRQLATAAFLRIRELLWQAPQAARAWEPVATALEEGDLAAARVPARRLENVLKITPMFRESLRELKTGIQGIPIQRFQGEGAPTFGVPRAMRFAARSLDLSPTAGRALATGDFDLDGRADIARLRADGGLEIRLASTGFAPSAPMPQPLDRESPGDSTSDHAATSIPSESDATHAELAQDQPVEAPPTIDALAAVDLDNDGFLDLIATGPRQARAWIGDGGGGFAPRMDAFGLGGARQVEPIDFDIEGDLDLAAIDGDGRPTLWRNALEGPLVEVGPQMLPAGLPFVDARALQASDVDGDGDLDLVLAHARGLSWLDNLRQGRFVDRSAVSGLRTGPALTAVATGDLDNDGAVELIAVGPEGLRIERREAAVDPRAGVQDAITFEPADGPLGDAAGRNLSDLAVFDADHDGRLDVAVVGPDGLAVLRLGDGPAAELDGAATGFSSLEAADLDGDGDLDLVTAGDGGLAWHENLDGADGGWLAVRLRGLTQGNSKNNVLGTGTLVELRDGEYFQMREARGEVVHFGLGGRDTAEVLRIVWTNGVPQNRVGVEGNQLVVEEQQLKGSCPFLYTWDGEEFAFVTDLLWGAPIGLPAAPGVWIGADPDELVRIDGARPTDDGRLRLRLTEELWEAAIFDRARLWVVDHPAEVEVASALKIIPGAATPQEVRGSRDLRTLAQALDGAGRDVTARVAARDEVYADGYDLSPYQGVAEPWAFTFDLGEAPNGPIRLLLDGWIFPSDASLNLAVAQRADGAPTPPRLEVETAEGWHVLDPAIGFPAGKTKTMVVDTPPLPRGAQRLRIVTSLWLHWDRIAWTTELADAEPEVVARLDAESAELRFRGFARPLRDAPNAPHRYVYADAAVESPWLPFPGSSYTRFGDVRSLLAARDDLSVVMAPGDEIALDFDLRSLDAPAPGVERTYFLESVGWDKDADRNTGEGLQLEPLPFHSMSGYPLAEGERFPDTPAHRAYLETYQTRRVD